MPTGRFGYSVDGQQVDNTSSLTLIMALILGQLQAGTGGGGVTSIGGQAGAIGLSGLTIPGGTLTSNYDPAAVAITGGSINNTPIGGGTPNTVAATALAVGSTLTFAGQTIIQSAAADTLALRNGTNAQALEIPGSYIDPSNHKELSLIWSSNYGILRLNQAGSQTVSGMSIQWPSGKPLIFGTPTTDYWIIDSSGHFLTGVDNTYDIGASGANRPRDVFIARNLFLTGIPTSDPHVVGEVWANLGILTLSAG